MKIKLMVVLLLVVGLAGCVTYVPPVEKPIENAKSFKMSYNDVWSRLVEWFASGAKFTNLDKDSGLITSEKSVYPSHEYLECGSGGEISYGSLSFNIQVKDNKQSTEVIVYVFSNAHVSIDKPWQLEYFAATCYSTGVFEQRIFNFIEGKPIPEKPKSKPKPKKRRH
jgi:hypothetical protein